MRAFDRGEASGVICLFARRDSSQVLPTRKAVPRRGPADKDDDTSLCGVAKVSPFRLP